MAFEILLAFYADGGSVRHPRSTFDDVCARFDARWKAPNTLAFPDGSESDAYVGDGVEFEGAMFNHSGGVAFFDFLFALLELPGAVVYWPEGKPCVASGSAQEYLPKEMLLGLGEPIVVESGGAILAEIRLT